jgi:hypothetical protein
MARLVRHFQKFRTPPSDADSMLAAGGQYNGTTLQRRGFLSMLILYGLDFWTTVSPLLTPRWQQGLASLKRLLRKSGALN